jgi:Kef-type K+ transport system membrane component KefB
MEQHFLSSLGLIISAAALFGLVGRLARIPSIVLYIFAGLVLGPVTGLVEVTEDLHRVAELGIALLLFLVGLELSFERVRDVGRVAVAAGLGQVAFTAAGGFALCWMLGFTPMEALFLATALTFSSTVVVVKLLDQKGDLNSLYGRIAVGIFLVQDLVVIIVLTFLAGLGTEGLDLWSVVGGVGSAFGGMTLLLVVVLLASRYLLPRPFAWAARWPEMLFIWSLCWCFLAVMGAELLQLSVEIGAFLAGISLAQLPYSHDLRRRVHPLMNFFIAVFFVTLGVQMDLGGGGNWLAVIVLSLFVLIGNPLIFMIIITRMKYGEKTAFQTSVTVAQISEFSFIFAALGVSTGLIGADILSLTALVGLVTIAGSAYMILDSERLYEWVRRAGLLRMFHAEPEGVTPPPPEAPPAVIIVGMNALGRELAMRLHAIGERVVAIDTDPKKLEDLSCEVMLGDVEASSVLEEAGVAQARLVISALQIADTNTFLAYRCKTLGIPACVHAFDLGLIPELLDLDVRYLLVPKVEALRAALQQLQREGVVD